jgi:hypothetical protein
MIALRPPAANEVRANDPTPLIRSLPCPELPPYVLLITPSMLESMNPDSRDARNGRMQGMQAVIIEKHWMDCFHSCGVTASQLWSEDETKSGIDIRSRAVQVHVASRLQKTPMTVRR